VEVCERLCSGYSSSHLFYHDFNTLFMENSAIYLALLSEGKGQRDKKNDLSPLYQHLPNCLQGDYVKIRKKTEKTAIVCPMIKDEEGFLSEWVAYYQMHGFNHVIIYDDGSIDNGIAELKPWIETGFVTVKSNFTALVQNMHPILRNNAFRKSMAIKALLESDCKLEALKLGYDYHISLDMDEYVVPIQDGETVVDEVTFLDRLFRHNF
jgi:hypothetical protein